MYNTFLPKYWLFIIIFQREIMRKKHEMKRAQPGEFEREWYQFSSLYMYIFFIPVHHVKFLYLLGC